MKKAKKWLFAFILACLALSLTACNGKADENTADIAETTETVPLFETVPATTSASETTTSAQSMTETTTSSTESSETTSTSTEMITTTTEVTTTEMTTTETTTTETTTTTTTTMDIVAAPETAPPLTTGTVVSGQLFTSGIWWAVSADGDRYFYFEDAGNKGSFRDQENGISQEFTYESDGNSIVFHMGSASSSAQATVIFTDSKTAVITWESGASETLTYQGLGNFDTFRYYSNVQLCEMALDYYEAHENYRPELVGAEVQSDGKIAIQLYDNLGSHNSTSAWYTVDRFTAQGTDAHGNFINLAG